jgi:L-lactate dehydrogenase complex protein LldG
VNAREVVLARIAAAYRAAPPAELSYGDIAREYRTTSDLDATALTELLIARLVDYRALVRQCTADDL